MVDYASDPLERSAMESWNGVEDLLRNGAEAKFGVGTAEFLRSAYRRHIYMKKEITVRYGMDPL